MVFQGVILLSVNTSAQITLDPRRNISAHTTSRTLVLVLSMTAAKYWIARANPARTTVALSMGP
jgi:hypothetical protein